MWGGPTGRTNTRNQGHMHGAKLYTSRSPKVSLLKITPSDSFFQCLFPLLATLNSAVLGFSCLKQDTSSREHNIVKLWDWKPPLDYLRYLRRAAMGSGKKGDWGRKEGETPLHRGQGGV